jgi:hypothetical protein
MCPAVIVAMVVVMVMVDFEGLRLVVLFSKE